MKSTNEEIGNDLIVVIKPTSACNLRCKYCYTYPTASKKLMNENILRHSIKKCIEYCKKMVYSLYSFCGIAENRCWHETTLFLKSCYTCRYKKFVTEDV